jgi:Domain of unknown function (DU1801)
VAEIKTKPTGESVAAFINAIPDDQRRKDCKAIAAIMQKATKAKPKMWGTSIVGFGDFKYVNSAKETNSWFQCGFSPRKAALTLYLMGGYAKDAASLKKLGRVKTGGGCLYIKSLDDVSVPVLRGMIADSIKRVRSRRIDYSK